MRRHDGLGPLRGLLTIGQQGDPGGLDLEMIEEYADPITKAHQRIRVRMECENTSNIRAGIALGPCRFSVGYKPGSPRIPGIN